MDTPNTSDRRWIALIILCAAQFMVVLDASIVNVALPSIQRALDFSQENLQWVVNAYVLLFGGFLLLGGRAADLLGRRRMFIAGLGLFSLASLVGGFATSETMLIAARGVQGLGAAILSAAALSIITVTFTEGADRNKALGIWGAVAGSGGAAGVILGGILTQSLGWEWVLFVNVPIGIAAALLARVFVSESRREVAERRFDLAGAVSVTAGLIVLVYAVVRATDVGWGSVETIALLAVSVALLAAFTVIELRTRAPLMDFKIFRTRAIGASNLIGLLTGAALFAMFFFVTLYMQNVLGYSPLKAGLSYLPLALSIIAAAGVASQLTTRLGVRPVLFGGLVLVAGGLVWFSQVSVGGSYVSDILFPSVLAGWGLGLAFVPQTIGSQAGVKPDEAGLASGLINTSQQIGGAVGLAVLSTIATSQTNSALAAANGAASAMPAALVDGFHWAFLVGAGIAVAGALLTLALIRDEEVEMQPTGVEEVEMQPTGEPAIEGA
jgi:EmrB/QacA subfamily drug resistance transporter